MYQGQNNYKLWDIHTKLFSQKVSSLENMKKSVILLLGTS